MWIFLGSMVLSVTFDVYEQFYLLCITTVLKQVSTFLVMRFAGGFSTIESIALTTASSSACILHFMLLYYVRIYDIHMRRIHEKIKDQNIRFRALLDSITDVLVQVNQNYEIEFMKNDFMGISASEYIGETLWTLITTEESKSVSLKNIENVFKSKKPTHWYFSITHNNELRWFSARASSITDVKTKKVVSVTLLFTDITEKLIYHQRKQDAEKAEIRSQAKSEYISALSHEIRNPLQSILYSIQLLLLSKLGKNQERYVNNIAESSKMISSIIGNVLDISKIEAGKIELENAPLSVLGLIDKIGETFSPLASKKNLQILTFVDPKIPLQVLGDATRISQILSNFVSNAIKNTTKGSIMISAELISLINSKATILFKCKDTGCGISETEQKKLFRKFIQLDNKKIEGWGLGLSISKKLVHLMRGRVGVESKLGVGSTFWFSVGLTAPKPETIITMIHHHFSDNIILFHKNKEFQTIIRDYLNAMNVRNLTTCSTLDEFVTELSNLKSTKTVITEEEGVQHCHKYATSIQKVICIGTDSDPAIAINTTQSSNSLPVVSLKQPVKFNDLLRSLSAKSRGLPSIATIVPEIIHEFREKCKAFKMSVLVVEDNLVIQKMLQKLLLKHGVNTVDCASDGKTAVEKVIQRTEPYTVCT